MATARAAVVPSDAMTVARARAILGAEADSMTDDEVRAASDQAATIARIIMQMFQDAHASRPM